MAESFFTPGEMKLVLAMMQSLNGPINVDWDMCASITGHKDGGVASNQWAKLKTRKGLTKGAGGTPTKTTPQKRKQDGLEKGEADTPTAAAKKRSRKTIRSTEQDCSGSIDSPEESISVVKREPDL